LALETHTATSNGLGKSLCNGLVEDFFHGQRDNDDVLSPEELVDLAQGVTAEVKANNKSVFALRPYYGGFKAVDVGASDLISLFDLDGIQIVHEVKLASFLPENDRLGANGIDAPLDTPPPTCIYFQNKCRF
jgi:hypothetical protein